ncbi:DsrE family protein [Aurantiacibacter sp. MUD61]|uniref:DsrE family protein n=1 Tax=Aurantiacibacter sp. MUD61 TaxID=3009083 RepID=UPI0022F105B6|nr:DsrE family protein [Aurantiacibacter sp. MUD61]
MRFLAILAAAILATPVAAQDMPEGFATGPVFEDFGPHVAVEGIPTFPRPTAFRHSFDVARRADEGTRNRGFESAARFVNMHAANGIDPSRIHTAVVVHGSAVLDLLTDEALAARPREEGEAAASNGSAVMVRAMLDHGVRFIVCGQSATAQGVTADDLIPGVEMALSAMTAHALLQQQGYTVNPF